MKTWKTRRPRMNRNPNPYLWWAHTQSFEFYAEIESRRLAPAILAGMTRRSPFADLFDTHQFTIP